METGTLSFSKKVSRYKYRHFSEVSEYGYRYIESIHGYLNDTFPRNISLISDLLNLK